MRRILMAGAWGVAALVASVAVAKEAKVARPAQADEALPSPDYLPDLARAFLRQKMHNHGRDMLGLVQGVTLLRYENTRLLATRIASEPRLVRPIAGGDNDLNAALPEQLFVLQDELRNQARNLAEAARKEDDAELARAFARVTETCVACHSAYLKPRERK